MQKGKNRMIQTQDDVIGVRRVQPMIGAEIEGVDLRQPLSDRQRDAIWNALLKHKVIFFRDQDITRQQHIAFSRRFGDLLIHPLRASEEEPAVMKVMGTGASGADQWHSDNSYEAIPPAASILKAYVIPSLGGDTAFANAVAAYEGLPDAVKARIEHMTAVHEVTTYFARMPKYSPEQLRAMAERTGPGVAHPVVRIHPDTGERVLYVNAYTSHIVGLEREESDRLLALLTDQFKRPEYQARMAWRPNSIAFWDNRSAVHYAVTDYNEPRHLERTTIAGVAPPVGPAWAAPGSGGDKLRDEEGLAGNYPYR